MSLVPSASGIRFDAKSAVITTVSLSESPSVVVPPAIVSVPSISAFPANSNLPKEPVDVADEEILPLAVILFHLCESLPKLKTSAVCGTILALALTAPKEALIVNSSSVALSTPIPFGLCNSVVARLECTLAIRCSYITNKYHY